jgi:phospholipid/cholesterol/gamma-HCH transport system substrate-binding protein
VEKTFSSEDVLNTLQHNNENILDITNNLKTITDQLSSGRGTVGKLLQDSSAYMNLNAMLVSLHSASDSAQRLIGSLSQFSQGLNKKGTLINELTSDTVTFRSIKASVGKLQEITDTAAVFLSGLKETANNPNTMLGVMIHDETAGSRMKEMIKNLESSSVKLDEDLEAVQHNFLLRGYFRKKAKDQEKQTQEK